MGNRSYGLKYFIVLSIIFHIFIFIFFPMSLFFWMDNPPPEEPEQLAFYLVEYYDFVEIAQEGEDQGEQETETIPETTGNNEDLSIEPEEEPISENQTEKDIADDPPDSADESIDVSIDEPVDEINNEMSDDINDEAGSEEIALAESFVSDTKPIATEDAAFFVDIEQAHVIASDLSDEFINLPALTIPLTEDILEAFAEEESLPPPVEDEIVHEEVEESTTEYQSMEPELPGDPSLMVLQRVTPVYPKDAANEGIEGKVEFHIHVSESGNIHTIEKLVSSGDQRIDNVAERTVLHGWHFLEMPKPYTVHLEIIFSVQQVYLNFVDIFFTGDGL